MTRRLFYRLHRRLFPKTARAADLVRAARLREANLKMQEAAERRQRQDQAFRFLDDNVRYLEDAPNWSIDEDEND